jgi:hypothetical protein
MRSLLKRVLVGAYCHGWISFQRLDDLFERWPWIRDA